MTELFFFQEGLPNGGSVFRRKAARGIVFRAGKLLMLWNDRESYAFPGGGLESGESLVQALARELREETGFRLEGEPQLWAVTHERRRGLTADILEMESFYFLCDVGENQGALQLDEHEAREHCRPVWVEPREALRANRVVTEKEYSPWLLRDIGVLERLMEEEMA